VIFPKANNPPNNPPSSSNSQAYLTLQTTNLNNYASIKIGELEKKKRKRKETKLDYPKQKELSHKIRYKKKKLTVDSIIPIIGDTKLTKRIVG